MKSFEIGNVFARGSGLVARTWRSAGLFLLLVQIVNLAASFALIAGLGYSAALGNVDRGLAMLPGFVIAFSLLYLLFTSAGMVGATAALLKADRGDDVTISDSFTAAARMCLPALGLTILWLIGVYLGLILVIVPGCIVLAMWSVSVPALIAEHTGVIGAFGRSRELTKGHRFKIFLALLLALVALYIAFVALGFLWADVLRSPGIVAAIVFLGGMLIAGVLALLCIQALLVAIYGELIDLKGDRVVDVFA